MWENTGKKMEKSTELDRIVGLSSVTEKMKELEALVNFVNSVEKEGGMRMISFGHAGDGNVHLCVVRGDRDDETWEKELNANLTVLYDKAYALGGLASGEHGIGLSKRPYFLRQTAKENLQAMNAIKTALDPQHILNNGKSYLTGGNNNAGTF